MAPYERSGCDETVTERVNKIALVWGVGRVICGSMGRGETREEEEEEEDRGGRPPPGLAPARFSYAPVENRADSLLSSATVLLANRYRVATLTTSSRKSQTQYRRA